MTTILRPFVAADLPFPGSAGSEYDDFGPRHPMTEPPPVALDDRGGLAIDVQGVAVGSVTWHWVAYGPGGGSRCPNLGIGLLPPHRGHGYGTQAQRLLADLFFRSLNLNRVEASTDVTNRPEQRSLEKAGFTREGVLRGAQWRNGAHHDLVTYSVLRSEWEAWRTTTPELDEDPDHRRAR